jgi:hypothetical protein
MPGVDSMTKTQRQAQFITSHMGASIYAIVQVIQFIGVNAFHMYGLANTGWLETDKSAQDWRERRNKHTGPFRGFLHAKDGLPALFETQSTTPVSPPKSTTPKTRAQHSKRSYTTFNTNQTPVHAKKRRAMDAEDGCTISARSSICAGWALKLNPQSYHVCLWCNKRQAQTYCGSCHGYFCGHKVHEKYIRPKKTSESANGQKTSRTLTKKPKETCHVASTFKVGNVEVGNSCFHEYHREAREQLQQEQANNNSRNKLTNC